MGPTLRYLFAMSCGAIPALVLFFSLRPAQLRRLQGKKLTSSVSREITLALFWMYCGAIAIIGITPRWVVRSLSGLLQGGPWNPGQQPFFFPGSVSLEPFRTFSYSSYVLAGNILLFVPFGLLPTLLWRDFRWWKALLLGFDITLFIELCQLFIGRTFDIDDLMLNTLGVFCGFLLALILRRCFPRLARLQVRHL